MNELTTQVITQLGFPIACVIALAWFILKIWTQQQERADKREDKLNQQIDKFNDTLQDFNKTLISIDSRLSKLEKDN